MPAESPSSDDDALFSPLKKRQKIFIRHATRSDFERLVDWTSNSDDDWELNVDDFDAWCGSFPPQSFLAAADHDSGLAVGFAAGVRHGADTGFIGLYYVQREYRGCGVGALLWSEVTRRLAGTNMCLSAVPDMVAKYRDRHSFRCSENLLDQNNNVDGGTRVKIACGCPKIDHLWPPLENLSLGFPSVNQKGLSIVDATPELMEAIVAYDHNVCGVDRRLWCQNWLLNHRTGKSVVALLEKSAGEKSVLTTANDHNWRNSGDCFSGATGKIDPDASAVVAGFGQIHEIRPGKLKIGPLYADDHTIAKKLILSLLTTYPNARDHDVHMAFQAGDHATEGILKEMGFETLSDYYELFMFTKHEVPFLKNRTIFFADSAVNFV